MVNKPGSEEDTEVAVPASTTFIMSETPSPERTQGILTVTSGIEAGRVITVARTGPMTLGRAPDCSLPFRDKGLSREHATITYVFGDVYLADAGSKNGCFVNGEKVTRARKLQDGDNLRLGVSTTLTFGRVSEVEAEALRRAYDGAVYDGLTAVFNRKQLDLRLDLEIEEARRDGTALSVALFDVDHFKKVNDTYGHAAGDDVLRVVAALLSRGVRPDDIVGRYGGEEFVIVLRGSDLASATQAADRMRRTLAETPIPAAGSILQVTASAGVASSACVNVPLEKAALLALADERLYRAKREGRNRVVGAE
jgi:two-component system, cell cycle response regulator